MIFDYILPLADSRAMPDLVGGKGASLARLARAGLPVPEGFHVTTNAYKQFVAMNDLQPRLLDALEAIDPAQPPTLANAARVISDLFVRAPMPRDIADAIARAYLKLPGTEPAVAVRSSATAEDLPSLSFAGQQETFLNITGIAAVQDAVKRCWASLWTARALSYRTQHQIDHRTVALAVVVQILIGADAAGVMFTANPVTGARDQIIIEAAWGLGEAIVGGRVNPDTLIVDQATGRVLERDTADKQVMTVRAASSTAERPVPEHLRHTPVLNDTQAAALARLGAQIERLYQTPMDIEWTLAGNQFAIVQARPITVLPGHHTVIA